MSELWKRGDRVLKFIVGKTLFDGENYHKDMGLIIDENGMIVDVVSRAELQPEVYEFLTPALIDAHSHVGLAGEAEGWAGRDYNEYVDSVTPHLRAIDSVNPSDTGFRDAIEGGVLIMNVTSGSANPIGAQGVILYSWTRGEPLVENMVIRAPSCIKMAFGENPKRVHEEAKHSPVTRMGIVGVIRKALVETLSYLSDEERKRDLVKEALSLVLNRKIPVHAHAHRADDIATAVRIAQEFQLKLVIVHGTESHKIKRFLAHHRIPVILGPSMTSRMKRELEEVSFDTAIALYQAGVKFSITVDAPVIPITYLRLMAGIANSRGLPSIEALKAITSSPAEILELKDKGKLRKNFEATMVAWSGDPLQVNTKLVKAWIKGSEVEEG